MKLYYLLNHIVDENNIEKIKVVVIINNASVILKK